MPSVSKLYHGSPVAGLTRLEPRLDPRTGKTALFVTQYPEHAAIHALLEDRARSEIDHTTKDGKFISGKVITPSPLLDQGYLYSLTGPEDAEELDEPTSATMDRVVTPEMIQAMGWDVEVRKPHEHKKQANTTNFEFSHMGPEFHQELRPPRYEDLLGHRPDEYVEQRRVDEDAYRDLLGLTDRDTSFLYATLPEYSQMTAAKDYPGYTHYFHLSPEQLENTLFEVIDPQHTHSLPSARGAGALAKAIAHWKKYGDKLRSREEAGILRGKKTSTINPRIEVIIPYPVSPSSYLPQIEDRVGDMRLSLEKQADLAPLPELSPSDTLYQAWKANPTPELMGPIITSMRPLMESQLGKYKGTLPPSALRGQAKKFMAQAIKSYDPTKGTKLTSHVVNSLQQLHRKNYEAQSAFRLSEELQRGIGIYHRSMENLRAELGREPTLEEISGDLAWPMSKIQRLARQDRGEIHGEDLSYDPMDPYQDTHDPVIDYVYHDLSPEDKLVMELATGYGGKTKLPKTEIAKLLKVTPARVTQRSLEIAKKLKLATEA